MALGGAVCNFRATAKGWQWLAGVGKLWTTECVCAVGVYTNVDKFNQNRRNRAAAFAHTVDRAEPPPRRTRP
jgi:hypothetical protein